MLYMWVFLYIKRLKKVGGKALWLAKLVCFPPILWR